MVTNKTGETKKIIRMSESYSSGLVSQSFWFLEFKKYLKLLKDGEAKKQQNPEYDIENEIKKIIINDNFFGAPNENRARRMFGYISNRANCLYKKETDLFFSSDLQTQKLINLVAILRGDRLFFEFINEVYREKHILGAETIELSDVNIFFGDKEVQSDFISELSETTKKRLRSTYLNFLTDCGLLTVTDTKGKTRKITPPLLDKELEHFLRENGESSIIKAITGAY